MIRLAQLSGSKYLTSYCTTTTKASDSLPAGSRSECSIQISSARNSYASNTVGGNDLGDAVLEEWSGWRRTSPMLSVRRRWSHRPQPWGVDVDPLVTGEENSSQDALPYSWQPGGPITLASGTRGAKAGNVRQE